MTDTHSHPHQYQLQQATPQELGVADFGVGQATPLRLTIHGECFFTRAIEPVIMVGDLKVDDFETASDQRQIVCYLYQTPKEGALISVDYGRGSKVVLDEPFSISKLTSKGNP